MSKTNYRSLLLLGALLAAGCTSNGGAPFAVQCSNCPAQPYYSMILTQPAISSDFPVAYRVQIPESDARLDKIKPPGSVSVKSVGQ